ISQVSLPPWQPAQANPVRLDGGDAAVPISPEALSIPASMPAAGMLLSTGLPFDGSALESTIQDFFDRIAQLGVSLTKSQSEFLYCAAIVAVAACVALEIARRRLRPAAPALGPDADERFPYHGNPRTLIPW